MRSSPVGCGRLAGEELDEIPGIIVYREVGALAVPGWKGTQHDGNATLPEPSQGAVKIGDHESDLEDAVGQGGFETARGL
jgi:hypothetical protein